MEGLEKERERDTGQPAYCFAFKCFRITRFCFLFFGKISLCATVHVWWFYQIKETLCLIFKNKLKEQNNCVTFWDKLREY